MSDIEIANLLCLLLSAERVRPLCAQQRGDRSCEQSPVRSHSSSHLFAPQRSLSRGFSSRLIDLSALFIAVSSKSVPSLCRLRGHKHDAFEGGTRVTSFISGGFVPAAKRGTRNTDSVVHIIDW